MATTVVTPASFSFVMSGTAFCWFSVFTVAVSAPGRAGVLDLRGDRAAAVLLQRPFEHREVGIRRRVAAARIDDAELARLVVHRLVARPLRLAAPDLLAEDFGGLQRHREVVRRPRPPVRRLELDDLRVTRNVEGDDLPLREDVARGLQRAQHRERLLLRDRERVGALRRLVEPGAHVELDVELAAVRLVEVGEHLALVLRAVGQRPGPAGRLVPSRDPDPTRCRGRLRGVLLDHDDDLHRVLGDAGRGASAVLVGGHVLRRTAPARSAGS